MPNTSVIDLRHFLAPSGALAPDLPVGARRLAEYWTQIVAQATDWDEPITLQCRRHPGHRRCVGILSVLPDENLDCLLWECPACGDNGVIRGWQDSFWDRSFDPEPEN